jgi:hypothetical protein
MLRGDGKMSETKYIPVSELKVGMEIKGYKNGSTTTFHSADVVSIKNNTVKLSWGDPLKNASDYMFEIELTKEELQEKYKDAIQEIREALNHDLGQVDGYHEMWNSWLFAYDLAEMASTLNEHKLKIIGYATLTVPKHPMFSDGLLDIGVVAEYEDGERIWCHFSNESRKRLLEDDF